MKLVVIFAVILMLPAATHAGPPFVTDDPEPPPPGGWEINMPFIMERTPHQTDMDAPLFDMNYGLPNVQLKFEIPNKAVHENGEGTVAGPGDTLLGMKWRFFEDEKSKTQLGTYPQVLLPTGDHERGLGDGRPAYILPFMAQKSWDNWTVYGNVGYVVQTALDKRDYWYAGMVLEREINERMTIGAELFGGTPKELDGHSNVAFNIGGAWRLSPHFNLLFSAGRSIVGDTEAMAYIGLQILTK